MSEMLVRRWLSGQQLPACSATVVRPELEFEELGKATVDWWHRSIRLNWETCLETESRFTCYANSVCLLRSAEVKRSMTMKMTFLVASSFVTRGISLHSVKCLPSPLGSLY